MLLNQDSKFLDLEFLPSILIQLVCNYYVLWCCGSLYLSEGFLHIQNLIGMSIIEWTVGQVSPSYQFNEIPINTKVRIVPMLHIIVDICVLKIM